MFINQEGDGSFDDSENNIRKLDVDKLLDGIYWRDTTMSGSEHHDEGRFTGHGQDEHWEEITPDTSRPERNDSHDQPLIVGVHGSWHTDEFWNDTIASGIDMRTVNLSSDQPGTSFDSDSEEVVAATEGFDEVFLVGHSRGGTVCLWAADKLLKNGVDCSVVLVNSAINSEQIGLTRGEEKIPPRSGDNYSEDFPYSIGNGLSEILSADDLKDLDIDYLQELAKARSIFPDHHPEVRSIRKSWAYMSRAEKVVELFYHDCTYDTQISTLHSLRPHRRDDDEFQEPTLGYLPEVPIYSIIGTKDRVIRPEYSHYIAKNWLGALAVFEIEGGHSLPIARKQIQEEFIGAITDITSGKIKPRDVWLPGRTLQDSSRN